MDRCKKEAQQKSNSQKFDVRSYFSTETIGRIKAVIFGQCIGDAIGLLTEFMPKKMATEHYGKYKSLEYDMKINDRHRGRWETGDWTDDSDQMILLLECLTEDNGYVVPQTFASKLTKWVCQGFQELGDKGGIGIGSLMMDVIKEPDFETDPGKVSYQVWVKSGRISAPNGGVMRTSIMGVHQFWDPDKVIDNAVNMCKVTHYDQRCQASVVSVSVAISLMLRGEYYDGKKFNSSKIINESFHRARKFLQKEDEAELYMYMYCDDIGELNLSEKDSIGYTFKCVGAGFWAFKQDNFRQAIETVVMNAGDADTNAAVAGALLGCKLGLASFPETWLNGLLNKRWLDKKLERYLVVLEQLYINEKTSQAYNRSQDNTRSQYNTGSKVNTMSLINTMGPMDTRNPVDTRNVVNIIGQVETRSQADARNPSFHTRDQVNARSPFTGIKQAPTWIKVDGRSQFTTIDQARTRSQVDARSQFKYMDQVSTRSQIDARNQVDSRSRHKTMDPDQTRSRVDAKSFLYYGQRPF